MRHAKTFGTLVVVGILCATMLGGCEQQTVGTSDSTNTSPKESSSEVDASSEMAEAYDSEYPVGERIELDQVLYDQDGLKVTATGFGPVLYYAALNIDVENTGNEQIQVLLEGSSLNGWTWDASLVNLDDGRLDESIDLVLAPGEKRSCGIGFSNTAYLKPCGIKAMAQIGFTLGAYGVDSGDALVVTPELVVNLPGREDYVQAYDDSGTLAYDADGVRVIVRGIEEDDYGDCQALVYVENLSDKDIAVSPASIELDGVELDNVDYQFAEVPVGKRAVGMPFIESLTANSKLQISFRVDEVDPTTHETLGEIATSDVVALG